MSRAHAVFERRDGGEWFVVDVGSLNGTYVNGEQVDETKLATGDEVQVGEFKLVFFRQGSEATMAEHGTTSRSARSSSRVKTEFPDITISKIRFLEAEGLIEPERTPSGYRKFYVEDVERLKSILRMQRDEYLPLKVIKERLLQAGCGGAVDEDERWREAAPTRRRDGATADEELAEAPTGLQMSLEEMSAATGVERERIKELEAFGIVCSHGPEGASLLRRRRLHRAVDREGLLPLRRSSRATSRCTSTSPSARPTFFEDARGADAPPEEPGRPPRRRRRRWRICP